MPRTQRTPSLVLLLVCAAMMMGCQLAADLGRFNLVFTVGGTVSGLDGVLVLRNGEGDQLTLSNDGPFVFETALAAGAPYAVAVETQPAGQACTVGRGSGTLGEADVSDVEVVCTSFALTVGGTVSGLEGSGLVLANNGSDLLSVSESGAFTFATEPEEGAPYDVTVTTQPTSPGQDCTVSNGTGTVSAASVMDVQVTCSTHTYLLGGQVSGLAGTGLVLQNNGGDDLVVLADGAFTFSAEVSDGGGYEITVLSHPTGLSQTCIVTEGAGTIDGSAVTDVGVTCVTDGFSVGGTVSGLSGSGLVLQNNSGDDLAVAADGSFSFATPVEDGTDYAVTVLSQPTSLSQTCTVANDTGTLAGAAVTSVQVSCATDSFTVGGTVTGLAGSGLMLQNNGGDDLTIGSNGSFTFSTSVLDGTGYDVTVVAQPTNLSQECTLSNETNLMAGSPVSDVVVSCTTTSFAVGGTVTGLAGGEQVVLQNNGGDDHTVSANGDFTFATLVLDGTTYDVSVLTNPAGQICTVSSETGTMAGMAVDTVAVTCVAPQPRTIGGTVSNLDGTDLVLQNNGGDNLTINADGTFTFSASVLDFDPYDVTILTQPSGMPDHCIVINGSGTVDGANVTDVLIECRGPENIGPGPDLWLRAEDIAVADMAPVALWPDVGIHSLDAGQPTAAHRPIFRAAGGPGNMPFVDFDGVDDSLQGPGGGGLLSSDAYTVLMVVDITDQTLDNAAIFTMCENITADYETGLTLTLAGPDGTAVLVQNMFGLSTGTVPLASSWQLITLRFGAGLAQVFVNGAAVGSDNYTSNTVNAERYLLGGRSPGGSGTLSFFAPNNHAELFTFRVALSTPDREEMECYLIDKYDLSGVASNATCP